MCENSETKNEQKMRSAVQKTIKMWKWLRENPGENKYSYLERHVEPHWWPAVSLCFLCSISTSISDRCKSCALYIIQTNGDSWGCNHINHPWQLWMSNLGSYEMGDKALSDVRDCLSDAADQIVMLCEDYLRRTRKRRR